MTTVQGNVKILRKYLLHKSVADVPYNTGSKACQNLKDFRESKRYLETKQTIQANFLRKTRIRRNWQNLV